MLWTEPHLLRALRENITDTKTGFPLDMPPQYFPTSFPPHRPKTESGSPQEFI